MREGLEPERALELASGELLDARVRAMWDDIWADLGDALTQPSLHIEGTDD